MLASVCIKIRGDTMSSATMNLCSEQTVAATVTSPATI